MLRQTEPVLLWAPQMEGSQGLPTSQLVGRLPPRPSSQADWGTFQGWGCKTAVVHGSLAVAGEGSLHAWDGAEHPHKVVDYLF